MPKDLDDLLRRALAARNPLRGRELLPFTMTPEEMRAEVGRRRPNGLIPKQPLADRVDVEWL